MLDLKDVFYFVQIVDRGGFTAAGKNLSLPKSTLSHRVQELEAYLGVRLINRTSRQFGVTDVGMEFYQYAVALLHNSEVAEEAVRQRLSEPSGLIKVTTAIEIAQFALRDLVPIFLNRYPKVKINVIATDRLVDIVGEGYDLAIRGHTTPLQDSTLVQRAICRAPWYLFASTDYLKRTSAPTHPNDILNHETVSMFRSGQTLWNLRDSHGAEIITPIEPRFQSNDLVAVKEAACAGLGIAALPGYICRSELNSGTLQQVLSGWVVADARMSALMPYRNGLLPAVRLLVDFLAAEIPKITTVEVGN